MKLFFVGFLFSSISQASLFFTRAVGNTVTSVTGRTLFTLVVDADPACTKKEVIKNFDSYTCELKASKLQIVEQGTVKVISLDKLVLHDSIIATRAIQQYYFTGDWTETLHGKSRVSKFGLLITRENGEQGLLRTELRIGDSGATVPALVAIE